MSSHFGGHEDANEVDGASSGGYHRLFVLFAPVVPGQFPRIYSCPQGIFCRSTLHRFISMVQSATPSSDLVERFCQQAGNDVPSILVQAQHQRVNSEDCRHQPSYQNPFAARNTVNTTILKIADK